MSAGDITVGGKKITREELLSQGTRAAEDLCGQTMGKQAVPPVEPDLKCMQKVVSTYQAAAATMSDRELMIFNDQISRAESSIFAHCSKNLNLQSLNRDDVVAFNQCTSAVTAWEKGFEAFIAQAADYARGKSIP